MSESGISLILHSLGANFGLGAGLILIYSWVERTDHLPRIWQQLLQGAAFGLSTVLAMMAPLRMGEGLIVHIGSSIVGVGGLFGGWIPGLIAAGCGVAYRVSLGGVGTVSGVTSITSAAASGIAIRLLLFRLRRPLDYRPVIGFSLVLPVLSIASFLLVPGNSGWLLLQSIGMLHGTILAATTLVLGLVLLERQRRLEMSARLRESEERHRIIMEHLPAGVFRRRIVPGEAPSYIFVGGRLMEQWGFTPDQLMRDPSLLIRPMHPDDLAAAHESLDSVQDDLSPRTMVVRSYAADGTLHWLQINSSAHRLANGECVRDGIMTDITGQKRVEEALRESEARYRLLADHISDQILRLSPEGKVLYTSPAAADITGYTAAERTGHGSLDLVHPDDVETCARAWEEARLRGKQASVTYRLKHKDGHYVWVEGVIRPLGKAADPAQQEVVVVVRNIERRKAMEDQLRQSQRLEAVGQLTGGVAHQFNNILMVISGNVELLDAELSEHKRLQPVVHTIQRSVERGTLLTRQLMAFSRRQPLHPAALDVNELLRDTELLARAALPETIHLTFLPAAGPLTSVVDPSQLQNAMLNLILNARDAMPAGGAIALVTRYRDVSEGETKTLGARPGRYVEIHVQDTGSGMTPEVLARAVEPFFTTKEVGKGTGLGLSMVHGFAEQSGGHLGITSAVGKGTQVELLLPAAIADDQAASK